MFSRLLSKERRGFTLIELLLVIGIIAILASIVIVAINPTRQLGQARDAQRRADVNTILNAIYQYSIDNNGSMPGALSGATVGTLYSICRNALPQTDTTNCNPVGGNGVSLRMLSGSYVVSIPNDPQQPTGSGWTGYKIRKDSSGRITVLSRSEIPATGTGISVTR